MSNVPNDQSTEESTYRRRTVMGGIATGAGMSALGSNAAGEPGSDDPDEGASSENVSNEQVTNEWVPADASEAHVAVLSGDQAGVETTAGGCVHVTPGEEGTLLFDVVVEDAQCLTQAHVREGGRGEDGEIVATLFEYTAEPDGSGDGDPLTTTPETPLIQGGLVDDPDLAEAILTEPAGFHVTVHTAHNPEGEIRGQIRGFERGTDTEIEPVPAEFTASSLRPRNPTVVRGDWIDVSARIENLGDVTATQTVQLRIDGEVIAERDVELGCRRARTVRFQDVDTEDLEPGEYEHGVFTEDDSTTGTLTVLRPPEFVVSELDPDDVTVNRGDLIDVSARIENVGEATGRQSVELRIDDELVSSRTLRLSGGDSRTVTFEDVDTEDLEPGEYEHGVFTDDDSATGQLRVRTPSGFTVSDLDPEDVTVNRGDLIDVSARIENVGEEAGTQDVELRIDDEVVADRELELEGGDDETVTFEDVDTEDLDPGEYEHGVFTDDDSATGQLRVRTPSGFTVSDLDPDEVTVAQGDLIDVSARIENVGEEAGTQDVELRIDDEVVADRELELDGGDDETVTFEDVDTEDLEPGEYEHGVFTDDDSATGRLTVEAATDDGTIDGCTVIDEPGDYEIVNDITDDGERFGGPDVDACIWIRSGDVRLDGNGYTISGEGEGVGVFVGELDDRVEDVTVRDLDVEGFGDGISFGSDLLDWPVQATLEDVTATDNELGVFLYSASGSTLRNVTASGNGNYGVFVWETNDPVAENVTATENGRDGIYLSEVGNGEYTGLTATDNDDVGVRMGEDVVGSTFTDLTIAGNGGPGLSAVDGDDTLRDAVIEDNDGAGVWVSSNDLEFEDVLIRRNDGLQVETQGSSQHTASDLGIGDAAVFAFSDQGVSLDAIDRDDFPALPDDVVAVGDGVEVFDVDTADVVLSYDEDDVAGDVVELWRYEDGEWTVVDAFDADGTIDTELTQDGIYAPVEDTSDPTDEDDEEEEDEDDEEEEDEDEEPDDEEEEESDEEEEPDDEDEEEEEDEDDEEEEDEDEESDDEEEEESDEEEEPDDEDEEEEDEEEEDEEPDDEEEEEPDDEDDEEEEEEEEEEPDEDEEEPDDEEDEEDEEPDEEEEDEDES